MEFEKVYIDIKDYGVKAVSYWINCFDRELTILFKDKNETNILRDMFYEQLNKNYLEWNEDDRGYCCEEYMIAKLDGCLKEIIVAVIYDNEEEDNEEI